MSFYDTDDVPTTAHDHFGPNSSGFYDFEAEFPDYFDDPDEDDGPLY